MLALLCIFAVVLSMLEQVTPSEAPPAAALPPGYADACGAVPPPVRPQGLAPLPPMATQPRS